MSKLWILILSTVIFIPVFSYAEEEKCDQAIIDAGVDLYEVHEKARESSPEIALKEAKKVSYEASDALKKAVKSVPEYITQKKANDVRDEAYNSLKESEKALLEYVTLVEAQGAYKKARESLSEYTLYARAEWAYAVVMSSLPEGPPIKEVREEVREEMEKAYAFANKDYARIRESYKKTGRALDEAVESLPEQKAYTEARQAYERARKSLPEYVIYIKAEEIYEKTREEYYKAVKSLPEYGANERALHSLRVTGVYNANGKEELIVFEEANAMCMNDVRRAYEERKQRLSRSQSSRPNQSGSSSNSSGSSSQRISSGSKSSKGVQ